MSQNECVEPRDHPVRAHCPLLSHLQLLIQLIEEHPHIALLIVGRDNCFNNNGPNPGPLFMYFYFFMYTFTQIQIRDADDDGNCCCSAGRDSICDLGEILGFSSYICCCCRFGCHFAVLHCLRPDTIFAQVCAHPPALANPVFWESQLGKLRSIVCTPVFPRRDSNSRPHH